MRALREDRLAALEKQHFHTMLRIQEMDVLAVPEDAPERLTLRHDAAIAQECITFHQARLGLVQDAPAMTDEEEKDRA